MQRPRIPLLVTDDGGCSTDEDASRFALDLPEISADGQHTNMLGLNVTMQCPLRCDFCCYSCHPKRTERMPLELALDLVEQASELGVFSGAGFTGGEPFLWFDELLVTGELLREKGLPFNIVSAGHWASEPADAQEMIDALVDRGLYKLSLSTDPSHARFVPPKSIVNAALAASARGIVVDVIGAFLDPTASLEAFVPERCSPSSSRRRFRDRSIPIRRGRSRPVRSAPTRWRPRHRSRRSSSPNIEMGTKTSLHGFHLRKH